MIRDAARHPVAAQLVGRLQAQLVRHQFRLSLRPGRPRVSLARLAAVVDAVVSRDADRAEAAAVEHVRSVISTLEDASREAGERA
jgi:DNA-binding GntR family transcriptional regulator